MGHRSPRGKPRSKAAVPDAETAPIGSPAVPSVPTRERLAKFLASAGVAARRECEEFVRLGRVTVDGQVVTDLATRIDPDRQEVRFDDERVKPERKVYWWLNKPKGVLCTNKDSHGRRTVLDLLPKVGKRVYSVGRLDEESTGLLLLTNDGELALRLTHPRYGVPKTYLALVAGKLTDEEIVQMQKGVWLSDGRAQAHRVKRIGVQGKATRIAVVLKEGKNREIRRMLAKLGHKVMSLHRVAIGPLKIRKLKLGEARPATAEEVFELRKLARLAKGLPETDGESKTERTTQRSVRRAKPTTQPRKPVGKPFGGKRPPKPGGRGQARGRPRRKP
jgi:23S rRNA pseudouridine2605 synthase